MNYTQIEEHLKDDKKSEELLKEYQSCFDTVHYYEGLLANGAISTPEETDKAMKELAGVYMSLNLVITISDTMKSQAETIYFNKKKMELEGVGIKVVAEMLKREASEHVSKYRRIRNIFQSYSDSCDKAISVFQSSLKSSDREKQVSHK